MGKPILVTSAHGVRLEGAPISPKWILAGAPQAHATTVSKSRDRTTSVMVWECTAGEFVWHYQMDETVVVLSGEAFVTDERGEERRLAEGHVAVFPGGSSSRWRITEPLRKVAVLREDLPRFAGFFVRVWHWLLEICDLRGRAAAVPSAADRALPGAAREAPSVPR
jgi:hypothetical protein